MSAAPTSHRRASTTGTGSSKNLSYSSTSPFSRLLEDDLLSISGSISPLVGSPASSPYKEERPVALRPRLATGLPLSKAPIMAQKRYLHNMYIGSFLLDH